MQPALGGGVAPDDPPLRFASIPMTDPDLDALDDDASEAWQAPMFLAVAAAQMFALIFAVSPH